MNKLSFRNISLLVTSSINTIVVLFTNTFLVAYLLQNSTDNIFNVGLFYVIVYAILGSFYFVLSPAVKKFNKLFFYRTGIVLKVLLALTVVLAKDHILQYFTVIAVVKGIGESFYWVSYNSLRNELMSNSFIKRFISLSMMMDKTINIIFPILIGSFIDLTSFGTIAIYALGLSLVQVVFSLFIPSTKQSNQEFSVKNYLQAIENSGHKKLFTNLIYTFLLSGFRNIVGTLIIFFVMLTFGSNTDLGIITSVFSVVSIVVLFVYSKFYKQEKHNWLLVACAALSMVSMVGLLVEVSKVTLILYYFAFVVALSMPDAMKDINRNFLVKNFLGPEFIVENMAFIELLLNLSRVVGYLLLMLVGYLQSILAVKLYLVLITVIITIDILLIYFLERALAKLTKKSKQITP